MLRVKKALGILFALFFSEKVLIGNAYPNPDDWAGSTVPVTTQQWNYRCVATEMCAVVFSDRAF